MALFDTAPAQQPSAAVGDVFRDIDDARRFMAEFVPYFDGCRRVLDVASGWGIFMDHLRQAGVGCQGVDHHAEAVAACRANGHEVCQAEALDFLSRTPELWDGIMLSHIIEHFEEAQGFELLRSSWERLQPGGTIVVLTPNMANPNVREIGFWTDPTHRRPFSAEEIADTLSALGGNIVRQADSDVERQRYRDRWRRSPLRAAAGWTRSWLRSGLSTAFMQGDVVVVARKPEQ